MIFQPFKEGKNGSRAAEICADCGRVICSGELSYSVLGDTVCADCVAGAGYIAGDDLWEDMEYLAETYYPKSEERLFGLNN